MPRKGALGDLVPFSPFKVEENKTIPFGDDEVIVFMEPEEGVAFFGRVSMRVYRGTVEVFGHHFSSSPLFHSLFAPYTSLALSLWSSSSSSLSSPAVGPDPVGAAIKQFFGKETEKFCKDKIIVVLKPQGEREREIPKGWFEMPHKVADHFRPVDPFVIPGFHPLLEVPEECVVPQFVEPAAHKEVMKCIPRPADIKDSFSLLVCGPTHSGKSTYLTEPLIGPTFTHIRTPARSYYVGDTSPSRNPQYFVKSFHSLVDFAILKFPGIPLVINTCGWVQGMGRELLEQQIQYAKPNVIVNMRAPIEYGKRGNRSDADYLSPDYLNFLTNGNSPKYFDAQITCYSGGNVLRKEKISAEVRLAQMLSYFHSHSVPITSHIPYSVPWNKLRIIFSEEVAPSQALHALNGTVVGLCIDDTDYSVYNSDDSDDTAHLYPQFIVGDETPLCECIGTGIVRSIDPTTRRIYITVPRDVDPERLQRVNTLLRGSIPTPMPLSLEYGDGNYKLSSAPYTAVDTSLLKTKDETTQDKQNDNNKNNRNKNRNNNSRINTHSNNNYNYNNNNNNNNNNNTHQNTNKNNIVEEYGPDVEINENQSIKTNEGPKPVSEIGLEEELELLEEHENKKASKNQKRKAEDTESPLHKKQKNTERQEEEEEGESFQYTLEEALDREDDTTIEQEPVQYQGNQIPQKDGKTKRQMRTEEKRNSVSAKVAKRIGPAGANDIIGAKPAKRIPRKSK